MAGRRKGRSKKQPDYIKYCLVAGLIVFSLFAGFIAGFYAYKHYGLARLFHTDVTLGEKYPVRGIDVSNHNGKVNYDKVAAAGYSFVFVKASEGATFRDNSFKRNCTKASAAGLKVGAYHFFRKDRDGRKQATNFLEAVRTVHIDMPLVIDVEDSGNNNSVPDSEVKERLRDMVDYLKAQGYKVMFYTNGDGLKNYYKHRYDDDLLWLCSFSHPDSIIGKGHTFQQYSWWGTVDGVNGNVDLNVFIGSPSDWEEWLEAQR